MHAATIERFPEWNSRPQRAQHQVIDWAALGSEYDIGHVVRLWQRVMRFHIDQLPDDESIMWQLADKLQGRRSEIVRIHDAVVAIDRRHMATFREALDWLWEYLADEHGDHRHRWCRDLGEWIRIETEQPPITDLEDARRAIEIIDALLDVAADNVVFLREDA